MTRREWTNRYARRVRWLCPGIDWPQALSHAGMAADDQAERNGVSGIAWQQPEDAAEEFQEWEEC